MKTIPNRTFAVFAAPGDTTPATTASLLLLTLNQPPDSGFTFAAMRERNRIATAAEKIPADGEIKLEDADYEAACRCVAAYRWGARHPDILTFAEQFGL